MPPILSICIPTHNRRDLICKLSSDILSFPGRFELIVHIDGDIDGTEGELAKIQDKRIRLSVSENLGRASAIKKALSEASGKYVMIYDDDDTLAHTGLGAILNNCAAPLPEGVCGFIYHMSDSSGQRLGSAFGVSRSNFIKLRADENVTADKKEVVLREIVERYNTFDASCHRRVPTSLLWAKVALKHDVLCCDVIVGQKNYHSGGMTALLTQLKRRDPRPMYETHRLRFQGWTHGRYRSWSFGIRSALGALLYGGLTISRGRRSK